MSRLGEVRRALSGLRSSIDKTTIGTISAGVMAQLALVVSGIVAARALGPADRGRMALFQAIAIAASYIISLGLPTAVAFWIAKDGQSGRSALRSLRGILRIQAGLAVLIPAVAMAAEFSGAERYVQIAALVSLPLTLAVLAGFYVSGVLQGLHKFLAFNVYKTAPLAVYAIVIGLLWLFGNTSLTTFMVVYTTLAILTAVFGALLVRSRLPRSDGAAVDGRAMVVYGLKGQIGQTSPLESFQLDLLVVGAIGGPVALGLYVGALAFTNLPRFVALSIGVVAFPRVASNLGTGVARHRAIEALLLALVLLLVIVIPLEFLMGWLIPFFFGSAFAGSVPIARALLVSALFLGLRRVLGDVMRGAGAPMPTTAAEVVSWFVYAVCVWPLMQRHGTVGAAIAMALASAASLIWLSVAAFRRILRSRPPGGASLPAVEGGGD